MRFFRVGGKGSFLRTSLLMTLGTGIAQGIPIAFYPILSRLYSPSEFGVLALVTSTFTPLARLALGSYHYGILVQPTGRKAINMVALSLSLSLCVNLLAFPLLSLLVGMGVLPSGLTWRLLLVVCGCSFLFGMYVVYNEWCVRRSYFGQLSVNKVVNAGSMSVSKAGFSLFPALSGMGLVLGEGVGRLVSASMALVNFLRVDRRELRLVRWREMYGLLRSHWEYPVFFLPGEFLNTLAQSVVPFLFQGAYGYEELGQYSMAFSIVAVPTSVIGLALYDAYRSRANSDYAQYGNALSLYRRVFRWLLPGAILLSLCGYFLLPYVVPFVLGDKWVLAGRLASLLAPSAMVSMVNSVFTCMWVISNKLKLSILWQVLYFTTYIIPPYLCISLGLGIEEACMSLVCGNILAYSVEMYAMYQFSKGVRQVRGK